MPSSPAGTMRQPRPHSEEARSGLPTWTRFDAPPWHLARPSYGGTVGYESVQNGGTQFMIDWGIVRRLLKSYWTARLQYQYGTEVSMSDSHWYNPFSWSLPDVSQVEVDWDAVRADS